jgi:hypothetical protein
LPYAIGAFLVHTPNDRRSTPIHDSYDDLKAVMNQSEWFATIAIPARSNLEDSSTLRADMAIARRQLSLASRDWDSCHHRGRSTRLYWMM